jgi:F-type H+-transporting ATPase subunit beta
LKQERDVTDTELRVLVVTAQAGDADAFGQIVTRFERIAIAIGVNMLGDAHLARDAAQDAFVDAYLSLGSLRDPAAFPGWFRRIALKHADRQLRHGVREWPLDDFGDLSDGDALSESLESLYVQRRVRHALTGLPERQQALVSLFYLDGYSQQEIVNLLDLPLASVKKGLFLARKQLREEMQDMTTTTPEKADDLKDKVQFFIALQQHDAARVKALLKAHPELMDARTEWGVLPNTNYWPLGYTALHWAATTDDAKLLDVLLDGALANGADVNVRTKSWRATPLHIAAMMRRPEMTRRLLQAGANPGETDEGGHTPLHLAAYYGDAESARLLLDAGAPVGVKDSSGRTALDWAIYRGRADIADALRAKTPLPEREGTGVGVRQHIAPDRSTRILETGLKIIDFFAPLKRGGVNAIFTPKSGVGKVVTIESLIETMAWHYGGHSIFLGVEKDGYTLHDMALQFHETGLSDAVTVVYAKAGDAASLKRAAEDALAAAQARTGEVLLFADTAFAEQVGQSPLPYGEAERPRSEAKGRLGAGAQAAVTLIWYGDYTAGAEPEEFANLDSVITFEVWRAYQGLWPSIDPLHSRSTLTLNERHARLQRQARRLLRRFEDLRTIVDKDPRGLGALATDADRRDVERARKLHAFFSQPLAVAELYTNLLGEYVPLAETLDGVEAILDGKADDVPEDKLRFIGRMDRYFRR